MHVTATPAANDSWGFDFNPCGRRAAAMDAARHADLAASLCHVRDSLSGAVSHDFQMLTACIDALAAGVRLPPACFGAYYQAVDAVLEDRLEDAVDALDWLSHMPHAVPDLCIRALPDPATCRESLLLQALMTRNAGFDMTFLSPEPSLQSAFMPRLHAGLALLQQALPDFAGEVRGLVRDLVCVASDPAGKLQFDGGSHYQLWGGLFLNARFHDTPEAVVEVLVHESAHSLLFGFCTDEPLVLNDESACYASPLRVDPRPMDGIYHATFVSARMHLAMSRLLASGLLDADAEERVAQAVVQDRSNFEAGMAIVERHAELTPTGKALMQAAAGYMTSVQ